MKNKNWIELLEQKKQELLSNSQAYEKEIGEELKKAKEDVMSGIKVAVTIGLLSISAYFMLKNFWQENIEKPSIDADAIPKDQALETNYQEESLFQSIKREIALFLVAIAKQKLMEILQQWAENQDNTTQEDATE